MGANLSNFSGRAATAENVVTIVRNAPRIIDILSQCIYTREEARTLQTFFAALNVFISDTSPGSIVNAVGGLANLFLLTGTAIEWTNTEEDLYNATIFTFTGVPFGTLSNTIKSQLLFFYILSAVLFNSQNGASSFGNGYAMLQNKNFLIAFVALSGNNLAATQFFVSTLYKTFFFCNGNITMGNHNVVILFSPAILLSGALREVILNNNCENVGNNRNGGVSPQCIKAPAAGLKINCGIYVNTDPEQVVLVSPANFYPALSSVSRVLGAPVPFRSATRQRKLLTGRGWAREPVLEACLDNNSSVSCFDGVEFDRLTAGNVPQYHRRVPSCFANGTAGNGGNGGNGGIEGNRGNGGECRSRDVFTKGGHKTKKHKGKKCKSCGIVPTSKGCGCGGGGGGGGNRDFGLGRGLEGRGVEARFAEANFVPFERSSSSCSSSSSDDCCGEREEPPLFDGTVLQYLSSIQGALNVMSLKLNRLLLDERDFNSAEVELIERREPYFRRCARSGKRCRLPAIPAADAIEETEVLRVEDVTASLVNVAI